jgi:hypothetical protein
MKKEGCIEMGIKMTVDSVNTIRLKYTHTVPYEAPHDIAANLGTNLFILPIFTIVPGDGTHLDDI